MNRLSILLALLLLAPSHARADAKPKVAKPNVIYILADDLGYGDLSSYGQDKLQTPNIDRLASEGMKFTGHYSGNTVCSPSRAVLMTGQHSGHCYLRGNLPKEQGASLDPDMTVLPEVFKKAGYTTGAFGKWGLGPTNLEGDPNPLSHGFDEFYGWKSQTIAHTYYPTSAVHNGKEIPLEEGTFIHDLVMDKARDFIRTSAENDEPFFCYIPTAVPHAAMHAPKDLHTKWRKVFPQFDKKIGKYGAGPEEPCPDVQNPIAGFGAMMENLDNEVGSILELLEELGIDDNTIVMFSSDNGAHKEGGHDPKFWNSTGGLRGHKRDMHEGGIRAPMLARWPGTIKPGSTTDHLSSFQDVLPTCAELVGEDAPQQSDGISFLPTLKGKGADQKEHDYLYWEFCKGRDQKIYSQAVRKGKWKAYRQAGKPLELFDLESDPFEEHDLAKKYPGLTAQMAARMDEAHEPLPPATTQAVTRKEPAKSTDGSPRPNVLLLCVDDLRPELGCFGASHIKSPNIDRLAKTGRAFSRHYVQAPTCGASRYTLLTGQYGGASNNALFQRAKLLETSPESVSPSMPAWFRQHGYTTVSVGKVSHHPGGRGGADWDDSSKPEMPKSWTRHLMPTGPWKHPRGAMHGLAHGEIRTKADKMDVFQSTEGADDVYPDGLTVKEAIAQLDQLAADKRPFFLAVGIIRPHLPFGSPAKYLADYTDAELPKVAHPRKPEGKTTWHGSGEFMKYNRWGRDPNEDAAFSEDVRKHYSACVTYADTLIGQLLAKLDQLGLAKETIVVLWGDHGWHLGEHAVWGKHTLFEESLRSPLIISYQGLSQPGATSAAVVESLDLFPTLCELTGVETPDDVTGTSLRPMLDDPGTAGHFAYAYKNNASTVRTPTHRLIVHKNGHAELYDHTSPEKETRNIAKDHPELVAKLTKQLEQRLASR
ncbi:Arylsulfatase [Planctomycetes bacterium Pan216]|uniref:Arylsulfatase n=1 Tax=Kolteria novifilia TaxID=2527975 RepID=A0A518B385_9BACT|nr:Arylsulfatase [Planctomycetes bacterium Pan216]